MRFVPLLVLAACYGSAPPKPVYVPLPPLSNAAIDVESETHTEMENIDHSSTTCPSGKGEGDPACTVTHYTVAEPVSHTTTTATYGGQPITYAQFRVLTDPQFDSKLATLDKLSHDCQRANIPRIAGLTLLATAVIGTIVMVSTHAPDGVTLATEYGGIGLGLTSYALGYFVFGGNNCNDARELYNDLDMSAAIRETSVDGAEHPREMKQLAERFNAAHHHATLGFQ